MVAGLEALEELRGKRHDRAALADGVLGCGENPPVQAHLHEVGEGRARNERQPLAGALGPLGAVTRDKRRREGRVARTADGAEPALELVAGCRDHALLGGGRNGAVFVLVMLTADPARPVPLGSVRRAGGVLLRSLNHVAVRHRDLAGGADPASVRSGGDDRGFARAYGGNGSVIVYRGNIGVAAFPSHSFVGGIGRLHRGGQGITAVFPQGQAVFVQLHTGCENKCRLLDYQSKFFAVSAIAISSGRGKS